MDKYINRDDALLHSEIIRVYSKDYGNIDVVPVEYLADIPSADVQPVKFGRWEYSEKEYGECAWYFCSECDSPAEQLYTDEPLLSEFCPHCGARMDLKDGDNNA